MTRDTLAGGRFAGFLAAGLLNSLFGYACFGGLLWLGTPPSLAVVMAMIAGIAFNFGSIGTVFGSRDPRRLPRFLIVYAVLLAGNLAMLHALTGAHVPAIVAQALATLVIAPCSFVAMRRIVFAPPRPVEMRA